MLVLATAPCCMHVSCSSITPVLTCTLFARVLVLYRAVAWIRRVQRVNRSTGRIVRQQQRETCAHSGCDAHMPDTPHGALLLASHDAGVAVRLGWDANAPRSPDFNGDAEFALQHDHTASDEDRSEDARQCVRVRMGLSRSYSLRRAVLRACEQSGRRTGARGSNRERVSLSQILKHSSTINT